MKNTKNITAFSKTFFSGFLYFFGLRDNPIYEILEESRRKTDADKLADDWHKIGSDIRKVYEASQKPAC